jgi:hypothetical protein
VFAKLTWSGLAGLLVLAGPDCVSAAGPEDASPGAQVAAASEVGSNPYSVICDRNVFHLNPPPTNAPADKAPPPDLPAVFLSGFMKKADELKVLLVLKVKNPDTKGAPSNAYLKLAEGDKQTVMSMNNQVLVELAKVYAEQEKVDVVVAGTPMTLSLKDNGLGNSAPRKGTSEEITMSDAMRKRHPFTSPAALALAKAKAAAPPAEAEPPEAATSPVAAAPPPPPPPSEPIAAPEREAADTSRAIITGAPKDPPPDQP